MQRRSILIELRHLCLDRELSALRHGIACIHGKIQKNLLHLPLVATDSIDSAMGPKRKRNIFADDASQHVANVADESVQVQRPRKSNLLAIECKQLSSKGCAARGGSL